MQAFFFHVKDRISKYFNENMYLVIDIIWSAYIITMLFQA